MHRHSPLLRLAAAWLIGSLLTSCSTPTSTPTESTAKASGQSSIASNQQKRIAELQVVDCLLPGQMRMLGNRSYMTPRRPARLTAAECKIRGGEYVAYDRADFRTALNVWMPAAEQGDAAAQTNVGEIFERGAGGDPNYEAALIWYQKSAKQGYKRAQFNLGTFYEQGLGVEKDSTKALNWYRRAWGLPSDNIVFQSAVNEQHQEQLATINKNIRRKDLQLNAMRKQIASLSQELAQQDNSDLVEQVNELQALVTELETENQQAKTQKVQLQKQIGKLFLRAPSRTAEPIKFSNNKETVTANNINFGKYYALVIGVQDYTNIESLTTPINDIDTIATLLENRYGFEVKKVVNGDNISVMEAINNINEQLTENDNLLIFYAGHGARLQAQGVESGYWLPTNADAPPRDTFWVSNEYVTRHLSRFDAKRVLVVADSCYAGLLSTAPGFLMMGDDNTFTSDYIKYKADKRSRLLLSSGGDRPVLDNGGGKHSIFTKAFIEVLENNGEIITGPQLYMQVREKVLKSAKALDFKQEPEYKTIKGAGHEVGDFFFIPTNNS